MATDFLSRITFESKVVPGAVVTFKRVTAANRAIFHQSQAKFRALIREMQRERKPLADAYKAAVDRAKAEALVEVDRLIEAEGIDRVEAEKRVPLPIIFPDDQFADLMDSIDREKRIEKDELGLAGLRAQFVSIEGVTVDEHPPTIDELIASAPVEFVDELVEAANQIAGLGALERGESPWPGTSPQAEDGPKSDTTAPLAASESETA